MWLKKKNMRLGLHMIWLRVAENAKHSGPMRMHANPIYIETDCQI
jgi:hypothetical protein